METQESAETQPQTRPLSDPAHVERVIWAVREYNAALQGLKEAELRLDKAIRDMHQKRSEADKAGIYSVCSTEEGGLLKLERVYKTVHVELLK